MNGPIIELPFAIDAAGGSEVQVYANPALTLGISQLVRERSVFLLLEYYVE